MVTQTFYFVSRFRSIYFGEVLESKIYVGRDKLEGTSIFEGDADGDKTAFYWSA